MQLWTFCWYPRLSRPLLAVNHFRHQRMLVWTYQGQIQVQCSLLHTMFLLYTKGMAVEHSKNFDPPAHWCTMGFTKLLPFISWAQSRSLLPRCAGPSHEHFSLRAWSSGGLYMQQDGVLSWECRPGVLGPPPPSERPCMQWWEYTVNQFVVNLLEIGCLAACRAAWNPWKGTSASSTSLVLHTSLGAYAAVVYIWWWRQTQSAHAVRVYTGGSPLPPSWS